MRITIGYLYYDLLNLNGENGNIKILKNQLEKQGIQVEVVLITTTNIIEPEKYDLLYMGGGTENNLKIAEKHFIKYQVAIKKAIENHKFFLVTGNALDLFGNDGIKFFNFITLKSKKYIKEVAFESKFLAKPLVGLLNQETDIIRVEHPFFIDSDEGVHYNNFFGTKLFGPLFAKNPYFLEYFMKQLILYKNQFTTLKPLEFKYEEMAYLNYQRLTKNNLV